MLEKTVSVLKKTPEYGIIKIIKITGGNPYMTDIIFSFDTEDLANLAGLDGVLRTAEILRKHHVRGCFQVVGRLAEIMERERRTDVIAALKYHEIDDHSLGHSLHPTINEMTDLEDYNRAHDALIASQRESHDILRRIFGTDKFYSFCPPGMSVSYVIHYVSAELGIPVLCGGIVYDCVHGRPVHYCNVLSTNYDHCLEATLLVRDGNMVPYAVRSKEELTELYDSIAEERVLEVSYHHPTMSMYNEWWDVVNCIGANPADGIMKESKRNPQHFIDGYYENFDWLVGKIKADPRFRITTYENLAKQYNGDGRVIRQKDIPGIKEQIDEMLFPLTLPRSLCLSDLFHACRAFLQGKDSFTCGTVYGFLEEPYAICVPVTVTRTQMEESAKHIPSYGWLPTSVAVGDTVLGPADWLRAALAVLSGEETVTVLPGAWQIDLDQFPALRDLRLNPCGWPIETLDTLKDMYLSARARLQTWTIRLPEGTNRLIFED